MRKLIAFLTLLPMLAYAQSYTNIPNLRSGNMDFTATIRANGSACASGTAIVSGGGSVTCVAVIPTSQKGANNGVATLDSGGKVPTAQLPFSGLTYDGSWNANTNSPTLADGSGTGGHFYIVSVAGSQNLGSGSISFAVGDWALYNGTIWQKVPSSAAVSSVFGRTGAVAATSGDYTASQVTNTPAGGISSTTVQAAVNELDTEKQVAASTLTSWAALTRASGFDTFTQTPSSANLRGLLTDETGTGLAYFQGGALGTPSSGTLTSATGLPWSTGLTGVPTTAVGYGITGGAKLDAYAGGDTPSAFTLGIVDSADAATWRAALGAGTSSTTGTVTSVSGSGGSTGLTLTGGPITTSGTLTLGGTLADGSLSSNVPLKNAANTFTAAQAITPASGVPLTVTAPSAANGLSITTSGGGYAFGTSDGTTQTGLQNSGGISFFGTLTSHPLVLGTAGSGRMTLAAAGNVSIAAPSSGSALSVTGINATNTMQLTDGTEILYWLTDASHNWRMGTNGAHSLTFFTANTDWLTIDASGNIGALSSNVTIGGTVTASGGFIGSGVSLTGVLKPSNNLSDVSSAATSRTNLGVTATGADTAYAFRANNLSDLASASTARTNLGLATVASSGSAADLTGILNNSRLPATINAATDVQVGGVSVCRSNGTNCPSAATVSSGTWTPTLSLSNGTSPTVYRATYQRIGNIVNGAFIIGWTVSSGPASTGADITLPSGSPSNFTTAVDAVGSCNVLNNTGNSALGARLYSDDTTDHMAVIFGWGSSETIGVQCSYSYIVQ